VGLIFEIDDVIRHFFSHFARESKRRHDSVLKLKWFFRFWIDDGINEVVFIDGHGDFFTATHDLLFSPENSSEVRRGPSTIALDVAGDAETLEALVCNFFWCEFDAVVFPSCFPAFFTMEGVPEFFGVEEGFASFFRVKFNVDNIACVRVAVAVLVGNEIFRATVF